jgi:hypothetical protein
MSSLCSPLPWHGPSVFGAACTVSRRVYTDRAVRRALRSSRGERLTMVGPVVGTSDGACQGPTTRPGQASSHEHTDSYSKNERMGNGAECAIRVVHLAMEAQSV